MTPAEIAALVGNGRIEDHVIDYLDGEHCGWQLENTILSASIMGYQVRLSNGLNIPVWILLTLDVGGRTIHRSELLTEKPRIDLSSDMLK